MSVEFGGDATTVILAGTCTYSGATTVDAGATLVAGSNTALSGNSTFYVNMNGEVDLSGSSCTIGALSNNAEYTGLITNNAPERPAC